LKIPAETPAQYARRVGRKYHLDTLLGEWDWDIEPVVRDLIARIARLEAALAVYLGEARDANFSARDKALAILHEAE
jgi:hypothetical protein